MTQQPRTEAGTFAPVRELKEPLTRAELSAMGSEILKKLYHRATAPRFRPKESDRELTNIVRAFTTLAGVVNTMIRDSVEEDLERRIVTLEEHSRGANNQSGPGWRS